jgi:putative colanic acid biosynthesis acetyltransferase WcaF
MLYIGLWILVENLLVTNPLQLSSRLRAWALRRFGATIGTGVVLRPRLRVKYPWRLQIGDRCWIGEGVWLHNQATLRIGSDSVVSQETFVTTGSHDLHATMDLIVEPVTIGRGVWITSRCSVLAGVEIGDNAVVLPGSVVARPLPAGGVYGGVPARFIKDRWLTEPELRGPGRSRTPHADPAP